MRTSRGTRPVEEVRYCSSFCTRPLWMISNGDTSLSFIMAATVFRPSRPQSVCNRECLNNHGFIKHCSWLRSLPAILPLFWHHDIAEYPHLCRENVSVNQRPGRHLSFPISLENTKLEEVEMLLPVKFWWILFSGCRVLFGLISSITSNSTIFQLYLWRHIDVQAIWRRMTYGQAPNATGILQCSLRCQINTDTGPFCQSSHSHYGTMGFELTTWGWSLCCKPRQQSKPQVAFYQTNGHM